MKQPLRIAITTGDVDGIGTEIAANALNRMKPIPGVTFYLWRSPRCPARHLNTIDRHFRRVTVSSWPEALKSHVENSKTLIDINSNLPPPIWVEMTAQASHFGHIDGMATAPLSKTAIASAGLRDIGHTDILKRLTKAEDLFMGFIGDKFNVLLASGHLPLQNVGARLSTASLEKAVYAAEDLRKLLDKKRGSKPIALLGLNPHAGEEGLIGDDEQRIHLPLLAKLRKSGVKVEGPLVPDAAFLPANWKSYSVYVANYHDQGLIPFKMIHGQQSGLHITMGLPFVRTSVDHGTAKDIFGKDKADSSSMRLAIEWAIRLAKAKNAEKNEN
ncbi:MAG: 4-hydroxythreonine-4-phosphate dehydrogenase PdxA [Bdellovibrionaceae bacterium]|nr:4-hydroxythreonine-4-phosphate dehydrogenase PdxA [Pseudobdellovibrionaceae bacterium]